MTTNVTDTAAKQTQGVTTGGSSGVMFGGVDMSLEDAMALLFIQRAQTMTDLASDRAQTAQDKLKDIQAARDMLGKMRGLKQTASKDGSSTMPPDMKAFCQEHHIHWDETGNDDKHDKDEWDVNIQYMQDYVDKLSSDNDLFMIKLKSVINKSQEATQAADGLMTKNKEVVSSIVANFAR
jgi:hypothetical protein